MPYGQIDIFEVPHLEIILFLYFIIFYKLTFVDYGGGTLPFPECTVFLDNVLDVLCSMYKFKILFSNDLSESDGIGIVIFVSILKCIWQTSCDWSRL